MVNVWVTGAVEKISFAKVGTQRFAAAFLFVLTAATSTSAFLAAELSPKSTLLTVRILGSQRFQDSEILRATGLAVGSLVTRDDLQAAANRLSASGIFSSVRYRYQSKGSGLEVVFELTDATTFIPCDFSNFVWFSKEELLAALRTKVPLFTGEVPASGNQPEIVAKALESILKEHGIEGHVTTTMAGQLGGALGAMVFHVEGAPIMVQDVQLPGAVHLTGSVLGRYTQAVIGREYDPGLITLFVRDNLRLAYGEKGYLKAAVDAPRLELMKHDGPQTWVRLIFPVREGLQYRWGEERWSGNTVFSEEQLIKTLDLKESEIANETMLEKGLFEVKSLYGTKGYVRARMTPEATFDDERRMVGYNIQITEGAVYRMGRLMITGLDSRTADHLEQTCRLTPGTVYDSRYWTGFLTNALGRFAAGRAIKPRLQEQINDATQTVDVTISFSPGVIQ